MPRSIQDQLDALPDRGGVLTLPPGTFNISEPLRIRHGVTLEGSGFGVEFNNKNKRPWLPVTELRWISPVGQPMIEVEGPATGVQIRNLGLNGLSVATSGIRAEQMQGGVIENIGVRDCATGLVGSSAALTSASGFSFNRISSFYARCPVGIYLGGNTDGSSNSHHNVFSQVMLIYSGTGIEVHDADNNKFFGVYTFRLPGSSGYAMEFRARGRQNYVYGISPSGGVRCEVPVHPDWANVIFGYNQSNGEPGPVLEPGANLTWTSDGRNGTGWHLPE